MRKLVYIVGMLCLTMCFPGTSSAGVDAVNEATVISVKGDVKADMKGDGNWTSCSQGLKLAKGAIIKTGADSTAEIVFDAQGLNVLKLNPDTQITIDDSLVRMPQGSVIANFGNLKPGSSFTVKTPTAACGIRGSGMGVDFINGMTVVAAYKDKVYVQGLDAAGNAVGVEVTIPEGWKSEVAAGGGVSEPAGLTENEKQIWDAYVSAVTAGVGTEAEELGNEQGDEVDTKNLAEDQSADNNDDDKVISPSGNEDNIDDDLDDNKKFLF